MTQTAKLPKRQIKVTNDWKLIIGPRRVSVRHLACEGHGKSLDQRYYICRNCSERVTKEVIQKVKLLSGEFQRCYPIYKLNKYRQKFYYGIE